MHSPSSTNQWRRAFGQRLRDVRLARNYSQSSIANHLGVCVSTISCWENGQRAMPIDRLPLIADFFGVEPADLLP